MSELPGTPTVSIESVEWSAETGGNLTVRITGRWRRRRPISSGQPTLVIEAEGRRHRFPAMPEPPSVGGTGPGIWRLSFTVPGWMAPELGRTWLQFGTMVVPLPVAVPAPGEGPLHAGVAPSAASAPPDHLPPGDPELGEPDGPGEADGPPDFDQARRVAELTQRVDALEGELRDARAVRDELAASLEERERKRRVAEQRAHAEQALRRDLARQLSTSAQEAERAREAMGDLAAAEERIRLLEQDLGQARRRSDEAEQVAAAASAARQRAERERELAEQRLQRSAEAGAAETARLRFERDLRGQLAGCVARVPDEPVAAAAVAEETATPATVVMVNEPAAPEPAGFEPPTEEVTAAETTFEEPPRQPVAPPAVVASLRAELELRASEDAALRSRLVDAESRLAARVVLERRTTTALSELRSELSTLAGQLTRERRLRAEAEQRAQELDRRAATLARELRDQRVLSLDAYHAIGELRATLEQLAAQQPEPDPDPEPMAPEPDPEPVAPEPVASEPVALERAIREPTVQKALAPEHPVAVPEPEPGGPPAPAQAASRPPRMSPPPAAALPVTAPPALPAPPAAPATVVEPARLNDALSRLRETVAPHDVQEAPSTALIPSLSMHEALARPSLERVFRKMVAADADVAGRLLLELLPLQRVVYPHPVSYDLVLGADRCVSVSVPNGMPVIQVQAVARPRQEVDFQVMGDPGRLARMLLAGRWRRRFGRRVARVRGRREGVVALTSLLGAPLDLQALQRAGVRPDPLIALALVAAMIEPAWTATERFTFAHASPEQSRTYLVVNGGQGVSATRIAPDGGATTTMHCPASDLMAALAGEAVRGVRVEGDVGAYLSLRKWIKRAQSE